MGKKFKLIVKQTIGGVAGSAIGAALGPAVPIASLWEFAKNRDALCCFGILLYPPVGLLGAASFATLLVPSTFYGCIRGAQIGSCDAGGIMKAPAELFNHSGSSTLGSNFFTFYSKDAREKRKEERELKKERKRKNEEIEKIKNTINIIDQLRAKDEGRKHPRSLFSLFPSELIEQVVVEIADAQREVLDKGEASEIAIQHFRGLKI